MSQNTQSSSRKNQDIRMFAKTMSEKEAQRAYVNFLGDEGERRVHEAYPPATYARLAALKKRYDPTNLFHLNQNITPARTGLLAA